MNRAALRLPPALRPVVSALAAEAARRKLAAYAVGGCVRDWRLGRPTKDLDVVLESDPEPLARWCAARFGARLEAFDRFGTLRLLRGSWRIDFARARRETYAVPAALPAVSPAPLREDLERRDFSINAMAAPLEPRRPGGRGPGLGEVVDPLGGLEDLRRRTLRVLHPRSFRDDPTRLYRAARFAARFGFRLDPATERLRREAGEARLPALLSRERLRGELWRMLEEPAPEPALARARAWSLCSYWHPRFSWPAELARARDPLARLTLIGLRMEGEAGSELIRSLHLERPKAQAALAGMEAAAGKASPRAPLPEPAAAALRLYLAPPPAALKPRFLRGDDLRDAGPKPGPAFSDWLERAARAQWKGAFSTRAGALRWLRARVHNR